MCGICGQYNFEKAEPVRSDVIERMTRSLSHRGPDDEGFYLAGPVGFGFRRLSIIDVDGGHQPMSDRGGTVWVVFNGEIYNFPELRRELTKRGHVFVTKSDTEAIVHGYKEWGEQVLGRLNGMFGLAIWDVAKRKLVVARDPMGIKLIYYRLHEGTLHFGSEIRPILEAIGGRPELDPTSLNLFLRYRYTPSPRTLFGGIRKLAPGTALIVDGGQARVERWYRYRPTPLTPPPTPQEAKEELLGLYKRAVKRQLISDVPLGLLLSGGLDSGLLLGLMKLFGGPWPTYTVGYGKAADKEDELHAAASTARLLGAQNISVRITREMFDATLPKIIACLEEPIASASIVPMYFVSERARQDVKVALTGQGPDELFGGYLRHLGVHYGAYWRALPVWIRKPLTEAISGLPRNAALKRAIHSLNTASRMRRYQNVFSILPGDRIDDLFHDGLLPPNAGDEVLECWTDLAPLMSDTDELGGFQFLEVRSSLPDELLMYADKLSMAHGLEVRVPYLDLEVVEYVERLSANFKIRNGKRKWLHAQVCKDFLPPAVLRRRKRGFAGSVVDDWLRASLGRKLEEYLTDHTSKMYGLLRPSAVQRLLDDHRSGKDDNHKILFSLVVFEEWLRSTANNGASTHMPGTGGIGARFEAAPHVMLE